MGMLRRKTRILCTHHIKFLAAADVVVVMEDGRISMIGKIVSFVVVFHDFSLQYVHVYSVLMYSVI